MRVLSGPGHLLAGFGRWRTKPASMATGLLPAVIVFAVLAGATVGIILGVDDVVAWATGSLDGAAAWLRTIVRAAISALLIVAWLALAVVTFVALTLLVGEPFYSRIWSETERELHGSVPQGAVGWRTSALDSLRLVGRGLRGGALLILVGFVPVVGQVLVVVGGFSLAAWILANELLARPLEARGMDDRARRALIAGSRWHVFTFGLAVQACFWVPLGAVVAMPAAVVGATRLAGSLVHDPSADPSAA